MAGAKTGMFLRIMFAGVLGVGFGLIGRKLGGWGETPDRPDAGAPGVAIAEKAGRNSTVGKGHEAMIHAPVVPLPQYKQTATNAAKQPSTGDAVNGEPLRVSGYIVRGRRVNVVLSDGRTLTEKDRELQRIERNSVLVEGKKIFLKLPRENIQTPPQTALQGAE